MKLAYLVNQYPKVSHSFIRREIHALEARGLTVRRYALRGWDAELADPADEAERGQTRFVLRDGAARLLRPTLAMMVSRPARFAAAIAAAWRRWRAGDRSLALNLVTLAEACLLVEWMQADGITHVHAHFGTNSATVVMLARLLGGPGYSFTVHGPEEWDGPARIGLPEKIAHARFVVAISHYTRSQLCRWAAPQHMAKLAVVRCGLETAFHDQSPAPAADVPRFVCVGRLCTDKAQLLLVEAVGELARRGIAVELVLAGDGEARPQIEAEIARLGLTGQVRITGWISSAQVRSELLAARAMVLPSFAEGLPVVIMEALALRRPVLSTFIAGIPELVEPGVNGWLFAAGSVPDIVRAMTECLQTPLHRLHAMGQAGRDRVLARHDISTEAARLAELLTGPPS